MNLQEWKELLYNSLNTVLQGFLQAIPAILGAIVILFIGWLIAKSLRSLLKKVLRKLGFDKMLEKIKLDVLFEKAGIKTSATDVMAQFVYWLVMLIFLVAASETLGWTIISEEISKLVTLIPVIFSGIVLFVIGYYIAGVIRDVLRSTFDSLGVGAGRLIAGAIYYFLMVVITLSTLEHIGIDISIISSNVTLIIGAIVIAAAIAYGLAAREMLANTLSSYYGKSIFEEGQLIKVDDTQGVIEEIGKVSVVIRTNDGRVVLPSQSLTTKKVRIISEAPSDPDPTE